MIHSDNQYHASCNELTKLRAALLAKEAQPLNDEWLRKVEVNCLESLIAEIEADIDHYDKLKTGVIQFAKPVLLRDLPNVLAQARIAAGLSQADLANAAGIKLQQVQRLEASDYLGSSPTQLIKISTILDVRVQEILETEQQDTSYSSSSAKSINWHEFPAHEMKNRNWFDVPGTADVFDCAKKYILDIVGPHFNTALHRRKIRASTLPDDSALLAWQARVLELARAQIEKTPDFVLDDRWLPELAALTRKSDGPKRARKLLADKGIVLVTESHLPRTYLDGAAMIAESGHPVIGMTLRFDRLDNFWFVLFHELGHVFLHLFDHQYHDFFDDNSVSEDDIEVEADKFALNNLIPEEKWNQCLSRFAVSEYAVRLDAKTLGVDASIVAGRIRHESGDYSVLSGLVGQGRIRTQFSEKSQ